MANSELTKCDGCGFAHADLVGRHVWNLWYMLCPQCRECDDENEQREYDHMMDHIGDLMHQ